MLSTETVLRQIGYRLESLRIRKGYSSYESFALDHNLSRMQYWRLEKGKVNLTVKSLVKILNIHGISVEEFFKVKNPKKGEKTKTHSRKAGPRKVGT